MSDTGPPQKSLLLTERVDGPESTDATDIGIPNFLLRQMVPGEAWRAFGMVELPPLARHELPVLPAADRFREGGLSLAREAMVAFSTSMFLAGAVTGYTGLMPGSAHQQYAVLVAPLRIRVRGEEIAPGDGGDIPPPPGRPTQTLAELDAELEIPAMLRRRRLAQD